MLAFAETFGWEILHLNSLATTRAIVRQISESAFDDCLQSVNCRADDLCVLHFPFGGDVAIFKFVDYLVAQRFDLPTRFVAVQYCKAREALLKCESEDGAYHDTALAEGILTGFRHDVIPRHVWLKMRRLTKRKPSPKLHLDIPFDEALERFAVKRKPSGCNKRPGSGAKSIEHLRSGGPKRRGRTERSRANDR
jgi:hypothetical protein